LLLTALRLFCFVAVVASVAPAALITASANDIFTATASYTLHIQNSGAESNSTAFEGNAGNKHLLAINAAESFDLAYSPLPDDADISDATIDLDLAGIASGIIGPAGAGGYLPALSSTTTGLKFNTVSITVGVNTITFTVPDNPVPFQIVLPPSFYAGLLLNEQLQVSWQANTSFTRANPGDASGKYGTGNQQLAFSLSKTYTASAALAITYELAAPTATVPEPSTYAVMGLGLVGLGFWRRRFRQ
jgi:hypothetical protein